MIEPADLSFVVSLADLIVIVTALTIFIFGVSRGFLRQRTPMPLGAIVVAAGLAVAVLAHLPNLSMGFFHPLQGDSAGVSEIWTSSWFSWLLSRMAFFIIAVGFVMAMMSRRKIEADLETSRLALKDLEASRRSTDMRFQYLFNSTSNSMYSYEFEPPISTNLPISQQVTLSYNAVLTHCNRVFARELGGRKPQNVLGQAWAELESSKDCDAHGNMFREFVLNDYRVSNYALVFKTRTGIDRAVNVNMVGIVHDGLLERIWAVESNVLEYRQAKDDLRHQQHVQQFVARVSSRLVKTADDDADKAVEACMADLCAFMKADRSLLFWLDEDSVRLDYQFNRDGQSISDSVVVERFPRCWEILRTGEVVRIDSVANMDQSFVKDRKHLQDLEIKALLVVPMIVEDNLVGGLSVSCVNEISSGWQDHDVGNVRVICELLANFVLRLKSRRALSDALQGLQRATDRLEAENVYLREEVEPEHGFDGIVGQSRPILRSLQLVEQVADTMTPVLILGETGTGKELVARAIHDLSSRSERPLVKVNCAALPANLIESELFGHEKGAFTGADARKRGRFDLANGSTMFLDEIGEIPIELQAKLLRVLQEGEYERLGGTKTLRVDTRIVAATNRDLLKAIQDGEFRSDLFYRINTFPIEMPALRDRGDDIELLAKHFVTLHSQRLGREVTEISGEMMRQLRHYSWPGNVRELDGIVQRALISSTGSVLDLAEPLLSTAFDDGIPRILSSSIPELKLVERDHIVSVLEGVGWRVSGPDGAATLLGMPPSTLRSKMKKLGIDRPH